MTEHADSASGQAALAEHARAKAQQAREALGPTLDWPAMLALLDDRRFVRFPAQVAFEAEPLQAGEFAIAQQLGAHPREGYVIYVHPRFERRTELLPLLVAYHLVTVNYGDVADEDAAEVFGATLLGLEREAYYQALCRASDQVA